MKGNKHWTQALRATQEQREHVESNSRFHPDNAAVAGALGAAHIFWIPLVLWLRLEGAAPHSALRYWVIVLNVVDCISLFVDVVNVVRFARGERGPLLESPGRV